MNSLALPPLAVFGIGGAEFFWIFLILLVLFGGAKLPGLAKGLGQAIKEFKKASKDDEPEKPAGTKPPATPSDKANGSN